MFRRMDEAKPEEWEYIKEQARAARARGVVAEQVLGLLRSLEGVTVGFAVDQLTHCLQTATRAERDGADDELVVAALLHDVGKAISGPNHPAIAAAILRPYVRDDVHQIILVHQDFQGKHFYAHFGADPDMRRKYLGEPWYDMAARFADDWDQTSFDPDYDTLPLSHFEQRVRDLFREPRQRAWERAG